MLAGAGLPSLASYARKENAFYLHAGDRLWAGSHPRLWLRGEVVKGLE